MKTHKWMPSLLITLFCAIVAFGATSYNFPAGLDTAQNQAWTAIMNLFVQLDGSTDMTGDLSINATGKGLKIKSGTGNRLGTIAFQSGALTVISNTTVTANTKIFLQAVTANAGAGVMTYTNQVGIGAALIPITAQTNSYNWFMIEAQ